MNPRSPLLGAVALLCLLSAGLGYVVGQRDEPEAPRDGQYLRSLSERLELRTDQIERIDQLLVAHDARVHELLEVHRLELREPIARQLDQTESEILAILDEGQRTRYHELNRADRQTQGD